MHHEKLNPGGIQAKTTRNSIPMIPLIGNGKCKQKRKEGSNYDDLKDSISLPVIGKKTTYL